MGTWEFGGWGAGERWRKGARMGESKGTFELPTLESAQADFI